MLSKNEYAYGESTEIQQLDMGRLFAELFDHRLRIIFGTLCFAFFGGCTRCLQRRSTVLMP
jgi:hypothetical protein